MTSTPADVGYRTPIEVETDYCTGLEPPVAATASHTTT